MNIVPWAEKACPRATVPFLLFSLVNEVFAMDIRNLRETTRHGAMAGAPLMAAFMGRRFRAQALA